MVKRRTVTPRVTAVAALPVSVSPAVVGKSLDVIVWADVTEPTTNDATPAANLVHRIRHLPFFLSSALRTQ